MQTFPVAWLNGEFKKHRENVLVERERQLLPETQALIPTYRDIQNIRERLPEKIDRLAALRTTMHRLTREIDDDRFRAAHLEATLLRAETEPQTVARSRRVFSCPCPVESCRGFMDDTMQCGVCEATACTKCGTLLLETDAEHVCDLNVAKNFDMIKKQTRPCPNCAVPTFKISGCNQMWCTSCHTAWDWHSGTIVRSVIHNPHYFQYLRERSANGEIPRQPGDNGMRECNAQWPSGSLMSRRMTQSFAREHGEIDKHVTLESALYKRYRTLYTEIHHLQQQIVHLAEVEIPALQTRYRRVDNLDLRLKYLTNALSEHDFKLLLQRREKKREKDLAVREMYQVVVDVGRDTLWAFVEQRVSYLQLAEELRSLAKYANTHLQHIATQYKMKVQTIKISRDWPALQEEQAEQAEQATKRLRS